MREYPAVFQIRCKPEERERWREKAGKDGLGKWIRDTLNAALEDQTSSRTPYDPFCKRRDEHWRGRCPECGGF